MNLMEYVGKYGRKEGKIFPFKKIINRQGQGYTDFTLDDNQTKVFNLMCEKYVLPLLRADDNIEFARILFDKINFIMKVMTWNTANEREEIENGETIIHGIARCLNLSYHKRYVPEDKYFNIFREVECVDICETYLY